MQGMQVWSLIQELGPHMPQAPPQNTQNIKQKQYCNKFNKQLKNGPNQKNL